MTVDTSVRIHDLLDDVRHGRIMEAMRTYYADDVVMEEPMYGATKGLAANLEREQKFVDSVAEVTRFDTPAVMIGDGVSSYENVMEWRTTDGQSMRIEQVAVQTWRDGRIVHERFYYDRG